MWWWSECLYDKDLESNEGFLKLAEHSNKVIEKTVVDCKETNVISIRMQAFSEAFSSKLDYLENLFWSTSL